MPTVTSGAALRCLYCFVPVSGGSPVDRCRPSNETYLGGGTGSLALRSDAPVPQRSDALVQQLVRFGGSAPAAMVPRPAPSTAADCYLHAALNNIITGDPVS